MTKDSDPNTSPKQRRFAIKRGAAAVLYARSYRWACLNCGHEQFVDGCGETVDCTDCLARFTVASAHHVDYRAPVSPGTPPAQLFGPAPIVEEPDTYVLPLEDQPVSLTATSYQWICVECDPWCEFPQHTPTAHTAEVRCRNCHARYEVAEIRHWRGLPLTHRELTQHALHIRVLDDAEATEDQDQIQVGREARSAAIL